MSELPELELPVLGTNTLSPDTKKVWWENNGVYELLDAPSLFPEADAPKGIALSWPHVKPEEVATNPTGWYRAEIAETYGGYLLQFSKPPRKVGLMDWWDQCTEERMRAGMFLWEPSADMGLARLVAGPQENPYRIRIDRGELDRQDLTQTYVEILASAFCVPADDVHFLSVSGEFEPMGGLERFTCNGSFLASCLPSRRAGGSSPNRITVNEVQQFGYLANGLA